MPLPPSLPYPPLYLHWPTAPGPRSALKSGATTVESCAWRFPRRPWTQGGVAVLPDVALRAPFYPIHGGRGVSQPRRVSIPLPVVPGVAMSLAAAAGARRSCRAGPRPPLEPHGQPPARASTGSPTMAKVPFIGFPVRVIRHPSPRSNAMSCV